MRSRSPSLLIVLLVAFLVPTAAEAQVNRLRRAAENAIIGETARQIQRLLRDAVPLVDRGAGERHDILREVLKEDFCAPSLVTRELEKAEAFYAEALARGHEGVMAKALGAPYRAGRRGEGWLKVKRTRTLDLVVLAAEWGSGRRRGWLSNLHLGARDRRARQARPGGEAIGHDGLDRHCVVVDLSVGSEREAVDRFERCRFGFRAILARFGGRR